jgi:transposase
LAGCARSSRTADTRANSWTGFKGLILQRGLKIEIVKRIAPGFNILPKRWLVERTFAWLGRYRRLAKDYERKTKHSEATIYIASCKIMLAKLVKASAPNHFLDTL